VIFSSLQPSEIASVSVVGSRSGGHGGRLVALPAGAGTAFVPQHQFTSGERVSVTAQLRSPADGTASGASGASQLRFSFGVSAPARVRQFADAALARASGPLARASGPLSRNFVSAPRLHPPLVSFSADNDHHSGDIFISPNHTPQVGPMIINGLGKLVWFSPQSASAFNLEVQHYQGQPVLTWWQGNVVGIGYGAHGEDVIMNRSYHQVAVLHAGNGYSSDLHEFQLTRQGTALIDAYVPEKANLSSVGGSSNGTVLDCVIQELDIKTGKLLWEWHSLGHIPLSASERTPGSFGAKPYDYFHLNSIEQLPDGNLMVSARNTWALYKINRTTGQVMWTLGGKQNNFHEGPGTDFYWQHDAHIQGNNLTVFDDAWDGVSGQQKESESSAKVMSINIGARTLSLTRRFTHYPPLITGAEGSVQLLPKGNVFVGWGSDPHFSEYGVHGKQVVDGSLPLGTNTYRAYRFPWTATPTTKPSVAIVPVDNGNLKVYQSWNGATQVTSWRVLGGSSSSSLGSFSNTRLTGFETQETLHSEPAMIEVQALGSGGKVVGTADLRSDPPHVDVFSPEIFARATGGNGQVPVGCFTGQSCSLSVRIMRGSSVLGQSGAQTVASGSGALIGFQLSSAGRSALQHASNRRLSVEVRVSDSSSGHAATLPMTLIPYSIAGSGPTRSTSGSPTIQLAATTGFVSASSGIGQLVAACDATSRACSPKAKVTAGGKVIATTGAEHLGAGELGDVYFTLTRAGQAMLSRAHGNQLAAQVTLTDGSNTASGQIALVHYR
jgi:Arylsulfotransferase (ASST)